MTMTVHSFVVEKLHAIRKVEFDSELYLIRKISINK